ncbi:MAG: helix-turn-helix transcriptional regulator [Verrucomicrobiaceae bacterium]|nr:helix-turn-helix transcriptional regulator [Verrucomicrobiaceae bacterium]
MKTKAHPGKEMMPTTSRLGGVLRRHREQLGLNLQTVASRAGITPVALHNLETGKSSAKSDTFERVANAMGLDYDIVTHEAAAEARHEEDEARRRKQEARQERAVL